MNYWTVHFAQMLSPAVSGSSRALSRVALLLLLSMIFVPRDALAASRELLWTECVPLNAIQGSPSSICMDLIATLRSGGVISVKIKDRSYRSWPKDKRSPCYEDDDSVVDGPDCIPIERKVGTVNVSVKLDILGVVYDKDDKHKKTREITLRPRITIEGEINSTDYSDPYTIVFGPTEKKTINWESGSLVLRDSEYPILWQMPGDKITVANEAKDIAVGWDTGKHHLMYSRIKPHSGLVRHQTREGWRKAVWFRPLERGDTVETGADGNATLALGFGLQVGLGPNSRIRIHQNGLVSEVEPTIGTLDSLPFLKFMLEVIRGPFEHWMKPAKGVRYTVDYKYQYGLVSIFGSQVNMEYAPTSKLMCMRVNEGEAQFTAANKSHSPRKRIVPAGFKLCVRGDEAPMAPRPVAVQKIETVRINAGSPAVVDVNLETGGEVRVRANEVPGSSKWELSLPPKQKLVQTTDKGETFGLREFIVKGKKESVGDVTLKLQLRRTSDNKVDKTVQVKLRIYPKDPWPQL